MVKTVPANYISPSWKHYVNMEYIEINFSGLTSDEEIITCVSDAVEMGLQRPDKSILALVNVKGLRANPLTMRTVKKLGKQVQPKLKKSALVGSVGIITLLMKIYTTYTGSKIKFFTDKETAIKYLMHD